MMKKEQQKILLQLAKDAISEAVLEKKIIDKTQLLKEHPWLANKGAVFVTINKEHHLRGCIGSIIAHQSLLEDTIANAKSAALRDPRFKPITQEELSSLEVELSLLTEPKLLEYKDEADLKRKIRVGQDGVIIKYNHYQATYLPSVWKQIETFEAFFSSLCQKAGLMPNCLTLHPTIYTYEALKIKDES